MASIDSIKDRLALLQQDFEQVSVRQQDDFPGEVYYLGLQAFGACHTEQDVKDCRGQLTHDALQAAFIKALRDQVEAPAYRHSDKAQTLRPIIEQAYAELHAQ